jgi:hypothetical protein
MIPIRKELTDLIRHLLSEYMHIGKRDKTKKTRDRVFDFIVLCNPSRNASSFGYLLMRLVKAIQLQDTEQLREVKRDLERINKVPGEDIRAILIKVCALALSRWDKRITRLKAIASSPTLEKWLDDGEALL